MERSIQKNEKSDTIHTGNGTAARRIQKVLQKMRLHAQLRRNKLPQMRARPKRSKADIRPKKVRKHKRKGTGKNTAKRDAGNYRIRKP